MKQCNNTACLYTILPLLLVSIMFILFNPLVIVPNGCLIHTSLWLLKNFCYIESQDTSHSAPMCFFLVVIVNVWEHLWYSGSVLDCWSMGREINPAPGA